MTYFDQVSEAADLLRNRLGSLSPRIAIVLGSGLGAVADAVAEPLIVPYAEIPHLPRSTVEGHWGRVVAGLLGGAPVLILQGRIHFYEGYTPQQVTFPLRVLGLLGIRAVILTNAAGGIGEDYRAGQLVALADHIDFMGFNPLAGPNEPRFAVRPDAGLRFTDMTEAYSRRLRALAKEAASAEGFALEEGVYIAVPGPSFETPAEIRAAKTLGADLVGMSTVPEVILARYHGLECVAVSLVTNFAAGLSGGDPSHEETQEYAQKGSERFRKLLRAFIATYEPRGA